MSTTSSSSSLTSSSPYTSSSSSGPLSSSSSSIQLGGKGYRHKKNCKCRLCKKGGENTDSSSSYSDLEITSNPLTEGTSNMETPNYENIGGTRRRKTRKSRKTRKTRKSRKTKRRRMHK